MEKSDGVAGKPRFSLDLTKPPALHRRSSFSVINLSPRKTPQQITWVDPWKRKEDDNSVFFIDDCIDNRIVGTKTEFKRLVYGANIFTSTHYEAVRKLELKKIDDHYKQLPSKEYYECSLCCPFTDYGPIDQQLDKNRSDFIQKLFPTLESYIDALDAYNRKRDEIIFQGVCDYLLDVHQINMRAHFELKNVDRSKLWTPVRDWPDEDGCRTTVFSYTSVTVNRQSQIVSVDFTDNIIIRHPTDHFSLSEQNTLKLDEKYMNVLHAMKIVDSIDDDDNT